jgi:repressor LexA
LYGSRHSPAGTEGLNLEATMPQALTDLERRALDYIVEYLRENTYQPSIREIGRRFGLKSTKTVSELLQSIESKGYIERDPSRSRGVKLLGVTLRSGSVSVPVLGPEGETVDRIEMDRRVTGPAGSYFLTATDNHLATEGIREGDLLLVEPVSASTETGDLVVTDNDGPPRVGRTNSGSPGRVQGRVLGVWRRYRAPVELEAGGSES